MAAIQERIYFRCDASIDIGTGHVMRCLRLARSLSRRGANVLFICRPHPGDLISHVRQEFPILLLPEIAPSSIGASEILQPDERSVYSRWLGCSEEKDSSDTIYSIQQSSYSSPSWLVIDHYGIGAEWQWRILNFFKSRQDIIPRILVLDDLADRYHHSDVLSDPSRFSSDSSILYEGLVADSCTTFFGPFYALLDPVYSELKSCIPTRTSLARILVFFGGVDRDNCSRLALHALMHPRLIHIPVDIVVSSSSPHYDSLKSLISSHPNASLHTQLPSLAALITRADLCIGAAGTASWERVCLGLPSLIVPTAANQDYGARVLESSGVAISLDSPLSGRLVDSLQYHLFRLIDSPATLYEMSVQCQVLGDGRGSSRMAAFMLGPNPALRLRPACHSDMWLYYWWVSDRQVRANSFDSEGILPSSHQTWYLTNLESDLVIMFVLVDGDDLPLGQIRFEKDSCYTERSVISFSLDPAVRGRGLSSQLLNLGLTELHRAWGSSSVAYGEVLSSNLASARAFLRAGFVELPAPRAGVRGFSSQPVSSIR